MRASRRLPGAAGCGALAAAACLAVVYATPPDAYWVVDCGSRALLARRLLDSGFRSVDLDYPASALDPAGLAFPIPPPFAWPRGDRFLSQYPPGYPALAAPFLAALGPRGLRVPAALATGACAALFALWCAPAFGRRPALAAGLALAFATPLLFYGSVVWEHSLTVALPLGAVLLMRSPTGLRAAGAGALAAAACALRAELALMALALAAAAALEWRRVRPLAAFALGALPVLGLWLAGNTLLYGHPLGLHVTANVGVDEGARGAGELLRRTLALLGAYGGGAAEGALFAGAVLAGLAAGAWSAWRGPDRRLTVSLAVLAAGLCGHAALQIAGARIPFLTLVRYNGLIAQVPWAALAAVGAVRVWRDADLAPLRLGACAGLGFLLLAVPARVALTPFETGGFWGPRMLLPALPALLACALAALRDDAGRPLRTGLAVLAVSGLLASAVSVKLLADQKRDVARLLQIFRDAPQSVVVTDHPALGQQLAGAWGEKALLYAPGPGVRAQVERSLAGREYLWLRRARSAPPPEPRSCRAAGRFQGRHVPVLFDLERFVCRPVPDASVQ